MQVTDNMLYGIIGACVMYLILMYVIQKVRASSLGRQLKKAQADYEEARNQLKKDKQKLIDSIGLIYGQEQAHYVAMGKLWVGMPQQLLMIARGKANNIKQSIGGVDAVTQTWHYSAFDKERGINRETLQVVIVNNQVSSWKENP